MCQHTVTWEHDFPNELWLAEVFRHIDPTDVLSLSQTCKALRSRLTQKSVWIHILLLVCQKYRLFLGSYPIDYMDVAELRRLSLSPQMWDALVRTNAVLLDRLEVATPLRTVASGSPDWPQLDKGYLVPGGRFFVVLNDCYVTAHLEIWDLGVPRRKTIPRPTVLASKSISICRAGPDHDWLLTVDFLPGSDILKVGIAEIGNDVRINILSITPSERSPKFEELATLQLMGIPHPCRIYLHGSSILLRSAGRPFLFWDYLQGRIIKLEGTTSGSSIDEYIVTDEHVLHFGTHHVSAWNIPYLRHFTQGLPSRAFHLNSLETQELLPDWTSQYPIQPSNETARFLLPVQSTSGAQPSVTFDILLLRPGPHLSTIHRFTLSTIVAKGATSLRLQSVATSSFPPGFFDTIRPFNSDKRPAGDNVPFPCISGLFRDTVWRPPLRTMSSGDSSPDPWLIEKRLFRLQSRPPAHLRTLMYHPSRTAGEDDAEGNMESTSNRHNLHRGNAVATLLEPSKPLSACPATGRFVYRVKNSSQDIGAAYLVDYL